MKSGPIERDKYADMTPEFTTHRPVNAVPFVCDAKPGIRRTADLPQIIEHLGE